MIDPSEWFSRTLTARTSNYWFPSSFSIEIIIGNTVIPSLWEKNMSWEKKKKESQWFLLFPLIGLQYPYFWEMVHIIPPPEEIHPKALHPPCHAMPCSWRFMRSIPWIYIWDHHQKCPFLLMAWVSRRLGKSDRFLTVGRIFGRIFVGGSFGEGSLCVFVCLFWCRK